MNSRVDQLQSLSEEALDASSVHELLAEIRTQNPEVEIEDAFIVPSWFVQQSTWLKEANNSDSAVYNYPLLFAIGGLLNEDALRRSLEEIVRRHQVFRSVFSLRGDELVQIVLPPEKHRLPVIDLTQLSGADLENRLRQLCAGEGSRRFDLARGPLLRASLLRLGREHHILQLTTHHLVHDDWSTGIFVRELSECYSTLVTGAELPLDYLPFQYGDYVRWLEEQLKTSTSQDRFCYWKNQLVNGSGFHHLSADFAISAKSTNRGARESIILPAELAASLKFLARKERVSLFMVLLAAFQALLHHYSKEEEIGVASCAANRPLPQVEGLIGRFGNDIFLRSSFAGGPTFRELLERMREVALSAYSDQSLPFGGILKEAGLAGERGGTGAPDLPFQIMFILQNADREEREIPGLSIKPSPFYLGTAKYDVTAFLKIEPALEMTLEYKTDLFRAATMRHLLSDYCLVLKTMVENPTARVRDLVFGFEKKTINGEGAPALAKKVFGAGAKSEWKLEARLLEVWGTTLGKAVDRDDDFFEAGGDSLLATRLLVAIERNFQVQLPVSVLLEAPTARRLAEIIGGQPMRRAGSSLVPIQIGGTRRPLFCIHGHLGEVFYGRNLSNALGPEQPLFGLRSQGLGGEAPLHSVEEMAANYLNEIRAAQKEGPYFVSGWCFGGMIAYELARLLRECGEEVALLLLFNAPAPGSLRGWPLTPGYLRRRIAHELGKLSSLEPRQKVITFQTKARGLGRLVAGTFKTTLRRSLASGLAADKVKRSLAVPDINVAAAKAYQPDTYSGRITLFLTKEARSIYGSDPGKDWGSFATQGMELHSASGDNQSLFRFPYVNALAEKVDLCLARARSS